MGREVVDGVPYLVTRHAEYQLDPCLIGDERYQLSPIVGRNEQCESCQGEADYRYNSTGAILCVGCIDWREGRKAFAKVYAKA